MKPPRHFLHRDFGITRFMAYTPDLAAIIAQALAEAELAERARDFVLEAIENAERVEFCEPEWGKYAGRVVARVVVDGEDLAEELIIAGLARAYDGGQRQGWCGS